MTFGSLFAGIGGFDLGFERAGMTCAWQVEIDDYARRVLAKHWPNVRRWDDVRTFPPEGDWGVDLICGGFPCQDISSQNSSGVGLDGERSGLWFEFAKIIRLLRPRFAVVENVAAITFRGLGRVLSDLSESGYDAEWDTLPAQAFGAPHIRERLFIVAHRAGDGRETHEVFDRSAFKATGTKQEKRSRFWPGKQQHCSSVPNRVRYAPDSEFLRMAHGIPDQLDRYRVCGNSVVPQIAEWIGRRIMESEERPC
jgi:DNA (cytosine-5)-methyltransferase 1